MRRLPKPKLQDRINTALKAGRLDYLAVCKIVRLDRDLHRAKFQHDEAGIIDLTDRIDAILEGVPVS
jgi:hypothetical protein